MKTDLGGDRLGSGAKNEINLNVNYSRSTHDLGNTRSTTMSAGTLVPMYTAIGNMGDKWSINLDTEVLTQPTIGPLFGSYKVQIDAFVVPIKLYNRALRMNSVGLGLNMDKVYLPQLELRANGTNVEDNAQVNPSSVLKYLGISGVGGGDSDITRQFTALDYLAYFDIYEQYYANQQENDAYILHNPRTSNTATVTQVKFQEIGVNSTTISEAVSTIVSIAEEENYTLTINYTGGDIDEATFKIWLEESESGDLKLIKITDLYEYVVNNHSGEIRCEVPKPIWEETILTTSSFFKTIGWVYTPSPVTALNEIEMYSFPLENVRKMREQIMEQSNNSPLVITKDSISPYGLCLGGGDLGKSILATQEGLLLKTYQSDLYNNWIKTETIEGNNGINEISSVDTSAGNFQLVALALAEKVWKMMTKISTTKGRYSDYINVVYGQEMWTGNDTPMYIGGLSKELSFEEVISSVETTEKPQGTLTGRGRMTNKSKGGHIEVTLKEPSILMVIQSITPRVKYSQGNRWDKNLKTFADLHKPPMDGIGMQDLITDQLHYGDTQVSTGGIVYRSVGKVPAWINYQTEVDQVFGNFAVEENQGWMVLNRDYKIDSTSNQIKDLTTYIDPSKYNNIFAEVQIDSMNFWVHTRIDAEVRRIMSANQIPNL